MIKLSARYWLFGLGTIIAIVASSQPILNAIGYCAVEGRILSDAEIVSKVIDEVYGRYPPKRYDTVGEHIQNPVAYASRDAFVSANSECCKIVDRSNRGFAPSIIDKLRGRGAALVEVKYRVENHAQPGAASTDIPPGIKREYHVVTNCGRVWNGI